MTFFRFPHTPHLAWLGEGQPRDDKVLGPDEVRSLLAGPVTIEEKLDGANLGFSVTPDSDLRAQNRGTWLTPSTAHPQFRVLWEWLAARESALVDALWPHVVRREFTQAIDVHGSRGGVSRNYLAVEQASAPTAATTTDHT